jgi:cobalamin 5'-phosphate synthase/cobalamin synthase
MPARERLHAPLQAPRAAVAFLTRIPVDRGGDVDAHAIARGAIYFPLVGAMIGGGAALAAWALALAFPPAIAALGAVATSAILSGALHIDGLADTADAYGAMDAERALSIMRDHAVGSFGVIAVFLDLAIKAAAITVLVPRPGGLLYLVAAGALSRSAIAATGTLVPYARVEAGLGSLLVGALRSLAIWVAVLGTAIAVVSVRLPGIAAALLVALASVAWAWHCRRRFGGITGDTLGAASEGSEVLVLLVGVALT